MGNHGILRISAGVALVCFATAALVTRNLFRLLDGDRDSLRRRIAEISRGRKYQREGPGPSLEGAGRPPLSLVSRAALAAFGRIREAVARFAKGERLASGRYGRLSRFLEQADLRVTAEEFVVGLAVLGCLAACVGILLYGTISHALILGTAAMSLPLQWVRILRNRRLRRFGRQLPDALNMMGNALRSGYSLLQAMDAVARELPDPMSSELGRVVRETALNVSLDEALSNLLGRVENEDLELVVTAILIQRQVGGNLAEVLDKISFTIRERMRIIGEVRVLTAQGRFSGVVIGLLPVFLAAMMYVINRPYMLYFFQHPIGRVMIGVAVLMQVAGALIIRRIVSIRV